MLIKRNVNEHVDRKCKCKKWTTLVSGDACIMYQIILIARIVDGTANAPRHLLYVILIFRSLRNRKLPHL